MLRRWLHNHVKSRSRVFLPVFGFRTLRGVCADLWSAWLFQFAGALLSYKSFWTCQRMMHQFCKECYQNSSSFHQQWWPLWRCPPGSPSWHEEDHDSTYQGYLLAEDVCCTLTEGPLDLHLTVLFRMRKILASTSNSTPSTGQERSSTQRYSTVYVQIAWLITRGVQQVDEDYSSITMCRKSFSGLPSESGPLPWWCWREQVYHLGVSEVVSLYLTCTTQF